MYDILDGEAAVRYRDASSGRLKKKAESKIEKSFLYRYSIAWFETSRQRPMGRALKYNVKTAVRRS